MSLIEIVVEGTLKTDGTVELDQKPNMLPGRVTVILRQESVPDLPSGEPFWQRMQTIWNAQKAAGHMPRSAEEIEAEQRQMRDEWDDRQQRIERLQHACRTAPPSRWNF
jgi:hypothetical protein